MARTPRGEDSFWWVKLRGEVPTDGPTRRDDENAGSTTIPDREAPHDKRDLPNEQSMEFLR